MKFTKAQLLALRPCADGLKFAESCNFDFAKIYDTCKRGDWLIWLLRKSGNMDKTQAVTVALACAEHVLEIFERKYPDDKRPRKAIEAVKEWLKKPTEENRKACRAAYAAYAAYADAAAAAAAAAAAYAAYAAYADAAADAAAAAAYAYARLTERKWRADKIRELIPNPFKEGK